MWDLASGLAVPFPDVHNGSIRNVEFSNDGKTMVTASGDNTLILWDVTKHKPQQRGPPLSAIDPRYCKPRSVPMTSS